MKRINNGRDRPIRRRRHRRAACRSRLHRRMDRRSMPATAARRHSQQSRRSRRSAPATSEESAGPTPPGKGGGKSPPTKGGTKSPPNNGGNGGPIARAAAVTIRRATRRPAKADEAAGDHADADQAYRHDDAGRLEPARRPRRWRQRDRQWRRRWRRGRGGSGRGDPSWRATAAGAELAAVG